MTVSYQGKSYPLCCSGCRDEFNDNPGKYVQKALLQAQDGGKNAATKPASASVGKDDDSFDGLVDEPSPKARPLPKPPTPRRRPGGSPGPAPLPAPKPGKDAARAASLLRLGQNLDKQGKTAAARSYYQQVVKDYADTPEAKTAAARSVRSAKANRRTRWMQEPNARSRAQDEAHGEPGPSSGVRPPSPGGEVGTGLSCAMVPRRSG